MAVSLAGGWAQGGKQASGRPQPDQWTRAGLMGRAPGVDWKLDRARAPGRCSRFEQSSGLVVSGVTGQQHVSGLRRPLDFRRARKHGASHAGDGRRGRGAPLSIRPRRGLSAKAVAGKPTSVTRRPWAKSRGSTARVFCNFALTRALFSAKNRDGACSLEPRNSRFDGRTVADGRIQGNRLA